MLGPTSARLCHLLVVGDLLTLPGVEGPRGAILADTFRFIFGGTDRTNKVTFDDVYVLSLPGFVWHKVEASSGSGPRAGQSCIVIGKRQMLSVGGEKTNANNDGIWSSPDPFPNGMAIMDLTNLTWGGEYDADADEYKSPDMVREWYDQGNQASVTWSSKEVQQLFAVENGEPVNTTIPHG